MRAYVESFRSRVGLLAVVAVWAVGAVAPSADAAFPGENGRIAFTSSSGTSFEVFSMNADGTDRVNLTGHSATDMKPAWSPDGSRIAFTSTRDGNTEVHVIEADGSNPARLTNHASTDDDPAWSPDGSRIVFASLRDGNSEIYVMDADGSDPARLTNHSTADRQPEWSPDGSRIAFTTNRDGNAEIYAMDADGTDLTRLTTHAQTDRDPSWSPDGSKIAFTSFRDGDGELYVMNADGGNPLRLTNRATLDGEPAWSPDGSKIAFRSDRDGNPELYVMDADGTDATRVTTTAGFFDGQPDWQPVIEADISLLASDSADPVEVGDQFQYTLTASNAGPQPATGVNLTDGLPDAVAYVSDDSGCTHSEGTVDCDLPAIPSGGSETVVITVEATAPANPATSMATVSAIEPDPDPVDNSAVEETVIHENPPPETTIISGPSGLTDDPTPTFGFSASEPGSTFECRVDESAFAPCTSPHTTSSLPSGPHTFSVRATDRHGLSDPTPASRDFRVCTGPLSALAIALDPMLRPEDPDLADAMLNALCS